MARQYGEYNIYLNTDDNTLLSVGPFENKTQAIESKVMSQGKDAQYEFVRTIAMGLTVFDDRSVHMVQLSW